MKKRRFFIVVLLAMVAVGFVGCATTIPHIQNIVPPDHQQDFKTVRNDISLTLFGIPYEDQGYWQRSEASEKRSTTSTNTTLSKFNQFIKTDEESFIKWYNSNKISTPQSRLELPIQEKSVNFVLSLNDPQYAKTWNKIEIASEQQKNTIQAVRRTLEQMYPNSCKPGTFISVIWNDSYGYTTTYRTYTDGRSSVVYWQEYIIEFVSDTTFRYALYSWSENH